MDNFELNLKDFNKGNNWNMDHLCYKFDDLGYQ